MDGEEPPLAAKEGLGRGFYDYGNWDDTRAAERVRRWFGNHSPKHDA